MSAYIHFTEEQKTQARQTDLVDLLHRQGEKLKRSGSEYEWRDGSQKVTIRGNLWFHQYERVGGDAVDFVRRFYNKSYPEAVEYLLAEGFVPERDIYLCFGHDEELAGLTDAGAYEIVKELKKEGIINKD